MKYVRTFWREFTRTAYSATVWLVLAFVVWLVYMAVTGQL